MRGWCFVRCLQLAGGSWRVLARSAAAAAALPPQLPWRRLRRTCRSEIPTARYCRLVPIHSACACIYAAAPVPCCPPFSLPPRVCSACIDPQPFKPAPCWPAPDPLCKSSRPCSEVLLLALQCLEQVEWFYQSACMTSDGFGASDEWGLLEGVARSRGAALQALRPQKAADRHKIGKAEYGGSIATDTGSALGGMGASGKKG